MANNQARAERKERELALRKADLLAAASQAFAEHGYSGAQVSEIAEAAGLSLTSVYSLFNGKDELYQEVIAQMAAEMRDAVYSRVEDIQDPHERLLCVIDAMFSCFEENLSLLRIYMQGTQGMPMAIRHSMGEKSLEIFKAFTSWLVSTAKQASRQGQLRDLDPETVALCLTGAVSAKAAHWIDTNPDRPLTQAAPSVRALFERVLGKADDS